MYYITEKGTKARTGIVTMKVRTRNRDINIAYDPQCNYEDRSKRTRRLRYFNIYYSKLLNPSFLYFYLHCLYLSVRIPASFPFGLVEDNLASSLVRFSDILLSSLLPQHLCLPIVNWQRSTSFSVSVSF